ncbi:MAG: hypothetical protein AABW99_05505 [archaeon]
MKKQDILESLKHMRGLEKGRKFEQSVDLAINFKGIDFKKAENRIEVDVKMPHLTGKDSSVKAVVFLKDKNFAQQLKDKVSRIVMDDEIPNLKKKDVDNLMSEYNIFLAEGPALISVGKYLGQQLAPKGRMPKLIPQSVQSVEQAMKTATTFTKITNKKGKFMPVIHVTVGKEKTPDESIAENIMAVYSGIIDVIPSKEAAIKSVYVKTTMGKPIKVGEKYDTKAQLDVAPKAGKEAGAVK